MRRIYKNADLGDRITDITVEDGVFVSLEPTDEAGEDLAGARVRPGLIEIHAHGCLGYDTMEPGHLDEMSAFWAQHGITAWLPTTMTMGMDDIRAALAQPVGGRPGCAEVVGFHLEGPYIAMKYKGAQNPDFVKTPDLEEFRSLPNVTLVTLAPEVEGALDFIRECDACVALGHTAADYDCCLQAAEAGAKCLTHMFNAMSGIHHRNPGPIGAAVTADMYVQLIGDGLHVHPAVMLAAWRMFGTDRLVLISDALRATGLAPGEYLFGGQHIRVDGGLCKLDDGTIAGSITTLHECVLRAVKAGIPADDAWRCASQTPAEMLGLKKGRIEVGYDAEFVVTDTELRVLRTVTKY